MRLERTTAFNGYQSWIKNGGHYSAEVLETLVHSMRQDAGHTKHSGYGRLRPSLIGDPCDRAQVLSYNSVDGASDGGSWQAWSGTWLHLAFQSYLLELWGDRIRIEHRIAPGSNGAGVTGKADWYWYGRSYTDEFRSITGPHYGDYKTINSLKRVDANPLPKHIDQVLYTLLTAGLERAYVVYQDRAYGTMTGWLVEPEQEDFDRAENRLLRLSSHTRAGTLPPMLKECEPLSGTRFTECPWSELCEQELMERGR